MIKNNDCLNLPNSVTNAKQNKRVAKIAITAAAKFGFPIVEIKELYGLFQLTKSFPLDWRYP